MQGPALEDKDMKKKAKKQRRKDASPSTKPIPTSARRVDSLTRGVKHLTEANPNQTQAMEALAAGSTYLPILVAALEETRRRLSAGDHLDGLLALSAAIRGVRDLVDLIAAVGRVTGIDTPPWIDQELGRLALAVREVSLAQAQGDLKTLLAVIRDQLAPPLSRLAPVFPHMEAQLATTSKEVPHDAGCAANRQC